MLRLSAKYVTFKVYTRRYSIEIYVQSTYIHCKMVKNYVYTWSTTVSVPLSELGLPHPLSPQRVCTPTPPPTKGGGKPLACR
jgi:hypothetical protein